jgi:hypothetical protein
MAHIGDTLGLFKYLASVATANATEMAAALTLNERYVLEWLKAATAVRNLMLPLMSRSRCLPGQLHRVQS